MFANFKSSVLHGHWSRHKSSSGASTLSVTVSSSPTPLNSNKVFSSGFFGQPEHKHGQKVLRSIAVCRSLLLPGQRQRSDSGSAQRASASEEPVVETAGKLSTPLPPQESLPEASTWDKTTSLLVSGATVVFFLLLVPQIIKNAANMMHGDLTALAAIAWVGYLTALLGNVMLLNYFLDRKEDGGALVQAIGATTNVVVLTQMYLAHCMPQSVYLGTAALMVAAAALSGLRKQGLLDSETGSSMWRTWIDFLGLGGVSALAQAACNTFAGVESSLPGLVGLAAAAAVLVLDRTGKLPERYHGLWQAVPAWSATFLFAFQPVAQLIKNFTSPDGLAGLSQATVVLAMVGNGLMVPRALLTRDKVWLAGSAWASFTGWAQLLSLFINHSPTGLRYLGGPAFLAASCIYFVYNTAVLRQDMRAKGLSVSLGSLGRLMSAD